MRALPRLLVATVVLSVSAVAQQPSPPDTPGKGQAAALWQSLRGTAAGGPTSFEVRWQPPATGAGALDGSMPDAERGHGSFTPDLLHVQKEGGARQEWLRVGRHAMSREGEGAWQLIGSRALPGFLPDPSLLSLVLAASAPEIVARSIAERDGVAVEQISMCLTPAQVDALVFAGAVFDPCPSTATVQSLVKNGRARPEDVPVAVVDVCLDVDVATRQIHRIHLRAMSKKVDLRRLMLNAPRGRAAAPAADGPAAVGGEAPAAAPKEWKDGLPVRDDSGMQVVWLEFVLRDHGKASPVVLDASQKALLGR